MTGTLQQLNISHGGMPKLSIARAHVGFGGVEGDWQRNRKYHGGPDRAVCLFSMELYDWLRTKGVDLAPGSVGENFTTAGLDLQQLRPGDRLKVGGGGGCIVEITKVRVPCRNLDQWRQGLQKVIEGHSGWVARVVQEGDVEPGDAIELLART